MSISLAETEIIDEPTIYGFLGYLVGSGKTVERFDFDTVDAAYEFGTQLRELIEQEGTSESIDVKISNTVVRAYLLDQVISA
jgi:hypothetical protein